MSVHKVSALRGGMGQMLLKSCCVSDRNCERCIFNKECIVQRIMYSPFDIRPAFVSSGESIGYLLECENYDREFYAGDELAFNLTLFGKTIVYFYQILQAFYMLGQEGLGETRAKFSIQKVTNTNRELIVYGTQIDMSRYRVRTLKEYAEYRSNKNHALGKQENRMYFHTPVSIKYNREQIRELSAEAVIAALYRRLYMLDCFMGIETKELDVNNGKPVCTGSKSIPSSVTRYSSTHRKRIHLNGIRGYLDFDNIADDLITLFYAGEITHIGKNTRFGFGRYTMTDIEQDCN